MTITPNPIKYTAIATAKGGRTGHAASHDGRLDVSLSSPKALGGDDGNGTNPEQLFAAGYAACFIGAMGAVATKEKVSLPEETQIEAHVGIGPIEGGFGLAITLNISLPGLPKAEAEKLIEKAHRVCPYSNATRNNVPVTLVLQ